VKLVAHADQEKYLILEVLVFLAQLAVVTLVQQISAVIVQQEPVQLKEDLVFDVLMELFHVKEVSVLLVKQVINLILIKLIVLFVHKELFHLMDLLVFLVYKDQSLLQKEQLFALSVQLVILQMLLELLVLLVRMDTPLLKEVIVYYVYQDIQQSAEALVYHAPLV